MTIKMHINGLEGIKPYLQNLMRSMNYENKGEQDAREIGETIDVAIAAIKKQIPKKPDLEGDGYADDGQLVYDTWICPCCGKHYEVDYDDYKHCPECGQAIDWSDENG